VVKINEMESSPEGSDGYDVDLLLSGKQKLDVEPQLLYSMKEVRKSGTDEAELCTCKLYRLY
jgi:hypothetical protein